MSFGFSVAATAIAVCFVDAFGGCDAGGLPFFNRFQLHFTDDEQNAGNQATGRTTQIELLCNADDANTFLAPIRKRIDSAALIAG